MKNDQNAYFLENRTGFRDFRISKIPYFENWVFMVTADWPVPISAVVNWYHLIALR